MFHLLEELANALAKNAGRILAILSHGDGE